LAFKLIVTGRIEPSKTGAPIVHVDPPVLQAGAVISTLLFPKVKHSLSDPAEEAFKFLKPWLIAPSAGSGVISTLPAPPSQVVMGTAKSRKSKPQNTVLK
jgi:hypothetical protein